MSNDYVEQRDNVYVVAGTRVSLDSIVYAFLSGQSAEGIAQVFRKEVERIRIDCSRS